MPLSTTTPPRKVLRNALILAVGGLTILGLAACKYPTPDAGPSASVTIPGDGDATASGTPTPTPSASVPSHQGTPIGVDCSGLISAQAIYDFNPNFTLKTGYKAAAGSDASTALGYQGLVCGWINGTSSDIIAVSVAHPSATDLATLKTAAGSGTAVSGIGDAAWFSTKNGAGEIQAFSGPYWVTISSVEFSTTQDASTLIKTAIAGIK